MRKVQFVLSQKDSPNLLTKQPALTFKPDKEGAENQLISLYDDVVGQTLDGFGGAVTEAAAVTLYKLSPANRKKILDAYYHPAKGIGYTLARAHINSSDFSCGNYAYVEQDGDFALKTFSIARDKEAIIPMLLAAQKTAGATLNILGSPWSPPAWMKTTGMMNLGGKLRPECRDAWARYYAKFVKAYRAEGLNIWALTIQNEPKAKQIWDSCIYTGEEERDFIRDHLGKTLRKEGLGDVEVYLWDHNKERLVERTSVVMDDKAAAKFVRGAAFHWYSGSHFEALSIVSQKYPGIKLLLSECCVGVSWRKSSDPWRQGEIYGHDIIGNLNHGMTGWIDWNVLLDEQGGPNHVNNFCNAPITGDTQNDTIEFNASYYYIGHFSKFIRPGARRIATSSYRSDLEATAFKNPDGTYAVVVINATDAAHNFSLRHRNEIAPCSLPPRSIATFVYK